MTEAQRQIIAKLDQILAASGGGGGGVTDVTGTAPIASSGGATPAISIAPATPSDPGSLSAADKTKLDLLSDGLPQNSKSTAYTLVLGDANKHILHPTADNNARTFTIPDNGSVAYPIGTMITFVNQINTVTIAITTDTMLLAGGALTGSRTLAAGGIATALKIADTYWIINGTGLT